MRCTDTSEKCEVPVPLLLYLYAATDSHFFLCVSVSWSRPFLLACQTQSWKLKRVNFLNAQGDFSQMRSDTTELGRPELNVLCRFPHRPQEVEEIQL